MNFREMFSVFSPKINNLTQNHPIIFGLKYFSVNKEFLFEVVQFSVRKEQNRSSWGE